ncbi:MAG: mitochondrial fission ELM1 family protein [Alphaproteobacteria bacterium]|nr:mitochondrial fission ELM1 family protein [Alphaproteobacteria bacterium]
MPAKTAIKTIWTLSSGQDGCDMQITGVAGGLAKRTGAAIIAKQLHPPAWRQLFAPYGRPAPQADIQAPWPHVVLAAGRQTIPYALSIGKQAAGATFTAILQNPRRAPALFDFIWAPTHDALEGDNVFSTLTSPHALTREALTEAAAQLKPRLTNMPRPWIAVLLGGPNKAYRFDMADMARLVQHLRGLAEKGAGLMISASRRTPPAHFARLKQALAELGEQVIFFAPPNSTLPATSTPLATNDAPQPDYNIYHGLLGLAQAIIVTGDSVNMVSEACFVGVPVWVFHLQGGSRRFNNFHKTMQAQGLVRALTGNIEAENIKAENADNVLATITQAPPANSANGLPINSTDEIVEMLYKYCIEKFENN